MNLRTLLSSKAAARIQIVAAAVSGISLLVATWISTLQIPCVEDTIHAEDATISRLRDQATKDLVQGLYATDVYTDRRIDLLDVRLERIMVSSRSKREQVLLEGAANKTVDQIKQWDSLFAGKGTQPTPTPIPAFDESTPVEQRLIELDSILSSARQNAYSRLRDVIEQIRIHESQKAEFGTGLSNKQVYFRVFQMCGLLSLVLAIVLESHKKYNEIGNTHGRPDMSKRAAESEDKGGSSVD